MKNIEKLKKSFLIFKSINYRNFYKFQNISIKYFSLVNDKLKNERKI